MPDEELSRTFAALADPTRRAMLVHLQHGPASVNQLAALFPAITGQAVSKHLRVLETAGLVSRKRNGQLRPAHLNGAPMREAVDWLSRYRRFYEQSFDRLDEYLSQLQQDPRGHDQQDPDDTEDTSG